MRKKIFVIAKLIMSVLLIWYLLHKIPVQNIFASLMNVNFNWLIVALAMAGLGKVISCIRWRYLLSVQDIHVPFSVLFCSLLVGYFFNNFLPSTIGGDAVRAYDVGRYSRRNMASFVTVITERVLGILALAVIALMAACAGFNLIRNVGQVLPMVMAFFVISVSGFFILTNRVVVGKITALMIRCKLAKVAGKISDAYAAFRFMRDHRSALLKAFLISALLQVNVLIYYYIISLSLNLGVSLFYFFCIIPIVLLVLQLPISINGIGVREGLYVFFLSLVGVDGSEAIAFSWIDFGMTLVMGLSGGVVFALRQLRPAQPE